ncbi:CPBP family intramembrane metalloprotease [Luteibacter aegosomaticola]|uniref:CPBP family intramembrane glutamic endopeptidase n=1 Tax=Luteibacter aegosomaticola TaxID=2911538 RepID=UPI001FF8B16A|nr:CPBP family intramembrane glutamic endopeptidase [Luteibacter aegosomaticola]UPG88819.1 CPBP family intramembrane metalloprotease [Luteibacter aegosomaticola]
MANDPAFPPLPTATLPEAAPRRPGPGWAETILIIAAYFALQFGVGGALGYLSQTLARLFPDAVPGQGDRLVIVVILTLASAAAITLWLVVQRWGALLRSGGPEGFGFTPPTGGQMLFGAVMGIIAPLVGGLLTQLLAGDHTVSQSVSDLADSAHVGMRVALLPVAVLVGPLVEEVLFRGALLALLRTRFGDGWAIAVSSVFFGVIHLPDLGGLWYAVPNLILVGAFCAWLRVQSRSIWPAFACHAANNALATMVWFT